VEKITEYIKVGLNPQICFTQMDKDRDVKNGIWGQVVYLNPLVMQKTAEEIRCRNRKSARNKGMESNNFLGFLPG
jgi:hypothetical protein